MTRVSGTSSVSLPSTSRHAAGSRNITSGRAGVVFVEHQGRRVLQRPGQQAFRDIPSTCLPSRQDDRVLADQIDAADVGNRD